MTHPQTIDSINALFLGIYYRIDTVVQRHNISESTTRDIYRRILFSCRMHQAYHSIYAKVMEDANA